MKSKKGTVLRKLQNNVNEGGYQCEKCGRKDHLTVDHIIPVHILTALYIEPEYFNDDGDNLGVLCRWCNKLKGAQLDHLDPRTPKLLVKYVKKFISDLKP